jgi:hypothetical protein
MGDFFEISEWVTVAPVSVNGDMAVLLTLSLVRPGPVVCQLANRSPAWQKSHRPVVDSAV